MNGQLRKTAGNSSTRETRALYHLVGLLCLIGLSSCTEETSERGYLPQSLARPDNQTMGRAYPLDADITTASISSVRRSGIFIQIPGGLPNELASHLLARFQEASIAKDLPLAATGTIPELTIKGIARAGAARSGTAVALVWEVLGPDGKRVKLLNGEAMIRRSATGDPSPYDPWAVVDEATLEAIADEAAEELASWYTSRWLGVPPGSELGITTASLAHDSAPQDAPIDFTTPSIVQQPATGTSAAPSQPQLLNADPSRSLANGTAARDATLLPTGEIHQTAVAPDVPAAPQPAIQSNRALFDVALGPSPGDGQLSLAAAVQEALLRTPPSAQNHNNAYRVIGTVALDPSTAGTAQVKIEWTVFTRDGTALGTINQSNEVEAASVAGLWGEIATEAGTAAAAGILELIGMPAPHA